ncbi:magnesium transporter CorA family protein [Patescibacteria group bacterium]|nr:magnesium transporter CorA family protein [Patescibacteria group bacterium]MBU1074469.1 magnesium transporter CorA family protein [Patescibacteria group bacterium]
MNIHEIKTKKLRWININNPAQEEIEYLRDEFDFHPLALEDCVTPTHRSKIDEYKKYYFMVLLFPIYDRKSREIRPAEVHFFIGKGFLVTIHDNELPPLVDMFRLCQNSQEARQKHFEESIDMLLYYILEKLLLYIYPMLDHLSLDIDSSEKEIFSGNEKKMVEEILVIRRNITDFRKIMQVHKKTLQKLTSWLQANDNFAITKNDLHYSNLIDHTKEFWDALGGYKEAIEALQETNESLISHRINDIMKTLTVISLTMLPVTVIASIFGMNFKSIPLADSPNGFWILILVNVLVISTIALYFKRKRWI